MDTNDYQSVPCEIKDGVIHIPSFTIYANGTVETEDNVLSAEIVLDNALDAEFIGE